MKPHKPALSVTRDDNFADWYQAVITAADMAEPSGVRGCMIIKPWGYGIWERIKFLLDKGIRDSGHDNCYFPLFIPLDLIQKEATHVEGFAKEMAVVTHHRLVSKDGQLVPAAPLETPLVVRPTSETMIGEAFARWIRSYRDLPMKLNQWANVVRWEMRPRLFLRTSEFLWQEGHTAHATRHEALEETRDMLEVYRVVVEDFMRIPVILGEKSASERFPGAEQTHTIEAMMQDGRALQSGTSHFLGQNFSRAANIAFQDQNGEMQFAYTTSWGLSTRVIGAAIMTHADDDGLRLPPRIAPYHVVVLPIIRDDAARAPVTEACMALAEQLKGAMFAGEGVRVHVDLKDEPTPSKRWSWIKKGAPLICEIGPRDLESGQLALTDRADLSQGKAFLPVAEFVGSVAEKLQHVETRLYEEAVAYRARMTRHDITTFADFSKHFESGSGFVHAKWCGDGDSEKALDDLGVTIRCLPHEQSGTRGNCVLTGRDATVDAVFAKAY